MGYKLVIKTWKKVDFGPKVQSQLKNCTVVLGLSIAPGTQGGVSPPMSVEPGHSHDEGTGHNL